jgi:hypothetical protein
LVFNLTGSHLTLFITNRAMGRAGLELIKVGVPG